MNFYLKSLQKALKSREFRHHAWLEVSEIVRDYLPARLVTRRRDYIFCRYIWKRRAGKSKGRWLPPGSLKYRMGAYGLLFNEAGHLLMVSDPSFSFEWNLPGGGVRKNETLEAGLKREFAEETGLQVEIEAVLHVEDDFLIMPTGQAFHAVQHFYLVRVTGGQLQPEGNGVDTSQVTYLDLATVQPPQLVNYAQTMRLYRLARERLGFRAAAWQTFSPPSNN